MKKQNNLIILFLFLLAGTMLYFVNSDNYKILIMLVIITLSYLIGRYHEQSLHTHNESYENGGEVQAKSGSGAGYGQFPLK